MLTEKQIKLVIWNEGSSSKLAKKLGVSEQTLINWKKGKSRPLRRKELKLRALYAEAMKAAISG